jgi:dipeptidase D
LIGVRKADLSVIQSRRMINLDSGSSHEICVSAVGAKMVSFEKTFPASEKDGLTQLYIDLFGGLGGHAGTLAHKNRACCINIMGELLYMLNRRMPVYLSQIVAEGPALHGACAVHASVPEQRVDEAVQLLQAQFRNISDRYRTSDPNLALQVSSQTESKPVLSAEDSANIIRLMFLLHTCVRKSDPEDLNIIMTSITFSRISLKDGAFYGAYHIRSLEDSVRDMWYYHTEEWLRLLGFELIPQFEFTSWPGGEKDTMQKRFVDAHKRLFGTEIDIFHLHASIEVNILMGQIPDMDAVAIQPTAVDFHTPKETLFIDQVQPYWDLLLAVLAEKD